TNAIAMHDMFRAAGIPCWVGGMLESAVGAGHCIALATLPGCTYPADIFPSSRLHREDLSQPAIVLAGPSDVRARETPGVGAEPDPLRLQGMTVADAVILPG